MAQAKRAEIIAKGDVQRAGYRDMVERIARKLNICGSVENIKPYDVRIIAEGEAENIGKFIKQIKIKKYPVDVEEIEIEFKSPTCEFEYFEIKRGDLMDELGERFDVAGAMLYKSVFLQEESLVTLKDMKQTQDSMRETQESMKETQDSMRETQDSMKETQDSMRETQDSMKETQDSMKETQDSMKETQESMNTKLDKVVDNTEIIIENTEEIKKNTSRFDIMYDKLITLENDMEQVKKVLSLTT